MKSFLDGFAFGAVSATIVLVVLLAVLNVGRRSWFDKEAVKAGKAEYYLDENNERQWRWK